MRGLLARLTPIATVTTLAAWAAASPSGRPDAAELRARLDQILSSGYQLTEPPQVRLHDFGLRLLRLLAELLSGIGQTRPLAGLPSWGKPVLAGALLVLLVVVFAHLTRSLRSLLSDRRLGGRELAQARERRDPNTVLREAEAAFERGENLVALSRLYLAVLLRLDRRGLLSHDPARTNWENLRALGEAGPETREAMTRLTREVDACIYGGRSASVSTWERARDWADLLWSAGERS